MSRVRGNIVVLKRNQRGFTATKLPSLSQGTSTVVQSYLLCLKHKSTAKSKAQHYMIGWIIMKCSCNVCHYIATASVKADNV